MCYTFDVHKATTKVASKILEFWSSNSTRLQMNLVDLRLHVPVLRVSELRVLLGKWMCVHFSLAPSGAKIYTINVVNAIYLQGYREIWIPKAIRENIKHIKSIFY